MATEVVMPKMGFDMTEGTILKWHKAEGDPVGKGDVLGEIETGKVNIEIEAFDAGVLRAIVVPEGQTVDVGSIIAIIGTADEEIVLPAVSPSAPESNGSAVEAVASAEAAAVEAEAVPVRRDSEAAALTESRPSAADGGRLRASPLARRMADENGVDLRAVSGSGPRGRIVRDDIVSALESGVPAVSAGPAVPAGEPVAGVPVPLSRMRQTIARRLSDSWVAAPHIFLTTAIDMGEALALRAQVNAALAPEGGRVSVNDLVLKATAHALRAHPLVNVSWADGARIVHEGVNLGVAVSLDDGLFTITVPDADRKSLSALAAEVADRAGRAREGKLTAGDVAVPSTFTVSNLGMYGIEHFTAIINPPEAAILAVGAATPEPVVVDGEVVARPIMRVTLSADHRVIDGASAAAFLVTLRDTLERPLSMLV